MAVTGSLTAVPVQPTPASPAPVTSSPTPSPTPTPTIEPPREPTDADRARFIAGYRPAGTSDHRNVAIDLDGDGQKEIVFAFVVDGEHRTQVDVADWLGTRYEITAAEAGGPAGNLADFRVQDLTADGVLDVLLAQTVGTSGTSASLWSSAGDGTLRPLTASGDCFDGSHTYGDAGVVVEDGDGDGAAEIRATCEEPDRPQPLWPVVVYVWDGTTYRCHHREPPDGSESPCQPGRGAAGGAG